MNSSFDPNAAAKPGSGIYGLPYSEKESEMILLPIPWEVTTSYGGGTVKAPQAIFKASAQMDLYDPDLGPVYERGIFYRKPSVHIVSLNKQNRIKAQKLIRLGGADPEKPAHVKTLKEINHAGEMLNRYAHEETKNILDQGKIPGIIGGDHSVPLGAYQALAKKYKGGFGILHLDAHSDTRKAFEGFEFSHASIMYNALTRIPEIRKLVQIGIRDFCEEEALFLESQRERIQVFYGRKLAERKFWGETWQRIIEDLIRSLPQQVWISLDIDVLEPWLCPGTGTPVPGGLTFQEVVFLIACLARSGRRILGFDLVEVAPGKQGEWDANVGMRLLYQLCGWTLYSCPMKG